MLVRHARVQCRGEPRNLATREGQFRPVPGRHGHGDSLPPLVHPYPLSRAGWSHHSKAHLLPPIATRPEIAKGRHLTARGGRCDGRDEPGGEGERRTCPSRSKPWGGVVGREHRSISSAWSMERVRSAGRFGESGVPRRRRLVPFHHSLPSPTPAHRWSFPSSFRPNVATHSPRRLAGAGNYREGPRAVLPSAGRAIPAPQRAA